MPPIKDCLSDNLYKDSKYFLMLINITVIYHPPHEFHPHNLQRIIIYIRYRPSRDKVKSPALNVRLTPIAPINQRRKPSGDNQVLFFLHIAPYLLHKT